MLKKLFELITGDDGVTLEPAYFWSALAVMIGFGLEIYSVAASKTFDMQAYGIGAAALLTGLGLSAKFGK